MYSKGEFLSETSVWRMLGLMMIRFCFRIGNDSSSTMKLPHPLVRKKARKNNGCAGSFPSLVRTLNNWSRAGGTAFAKMLFPD